MTAFTRIDPFTNDGVQCVSVYIHGWAGPFNEVFTNGRQARSWLIGQMRYWVQFTDHMDLQWYGYDPNVYETPDNPRTPSIGIDGYPDFTVCITNLDDVNVDDIEWEQA